MLTVGVGNAWGQASVGTTMWAEDFSGYSANGVPSGSITNSHTGTTVYSGTLTYGVTNGSGTTKVFTENSAGGTSPELLVAKGSGTFTIKGIPNGGATALTLKYKQNAKSLTVSVSGTGYSIADSGNSTAGEHTTTITVGSASTFDLTFTGPSGKDNVRLDDILITVKTAGVATPYTVTFTKTDGSTQAITEVSAGAGVTPPVMSTPCDGWAFQGWSKSQSTSSTSTTVLTTETLTAGKYYPSANTTLYPVYTKAGTIEFSSYTQLTLGSAVADGKYLISTGSYTMAGSGNTGASFSPGKTEATAKEYTITNLGDGVFSIKGPDGKYVGGANKETALAFSTSTPSDNNYKWKYIAGGINFQGQTTRFLKADGTSSWKNYASGGTTAYLYKRIESAPTYYYSYPNCCTQLGSINGSFFWTPLFEPLSLDYS